MTIKEEPNKKNNQFKNQWKSNKKNYFLDVIFEKKKP